MSWPVPCEQSPVGERAGGGQNDNPLLQAILRHMARGRDLREFLGLATERPGPPAHAILAEEAGAGYRRQLIRFAGADGDPVPAQLLVPDGPGPRAAVVIHHQHNGERHLGKSEVVGLAGDPLQAFGPALAQRGLVVLAPDSICFEDRRAGRSGILPDDGDWAQHYQEMTRRLVQGTTLMAKVLDDAACAVSLLAQHAAVDPARIGVLGHSYGGNTALFQSAVDERLAFGVASGALASYRRKAADGTGLEMALAMPGFLRRFEMVDVLRAIAPRPFLVVSATDDKYSVDADEVCAAAAPAWREAGAEAKLEHLRFAGGHALTQERLDAIIAWVAGR